jgi:drug/metabolite transporter (DMT)-like permease
MFYLIGSIVFTSWLTLALKMVDRLKISTLQSIAWNYIFCVLTGFLVSGKYPMNSNVTGGDIWKWAILIGILFIILFNVIAITAQKLGVAVASVSNKLSLVIPFLFSILFLGDHVSMFQIIGIVIALLSVLLTCMPSGGFHSSQKSKQAYLLWLLPILLFVGSGMLDTLINYIRQTVIKSGDVNEFIMSAFAMAAIGGILIFIYRSFAGHEKWAWKSILAGLFIGVPNYASIWCLMEVLRQSPENSSVVIPVNNIGIVLFSTLSATVIFKEKLSLTNWIGILLASSSILLIAFG